MQEQVEHLSAEQEKAKSVAVSITDSTKTLNENLTSKDKQTEVSRPEGDNKS